MVSYRDDASAATISMASAEKTAEHAWCMVIDLRACDGCKLCTLACQKRHNLRDEQTWINVYEMKDSSGGTFNMPRPCMMCEDPPCMYICPVGANIRTSEGLDLVDTDICIGSRACMAACPYEARYSTWTDPLPRSGCRWPTHHRCRCRKKAPWASACSAPTGCRTGSYLPASPDARWVCCISATWSPTSPSTVRARAWCSRSSCTRTTPCGTRRSSGPTRASTTSSATARNLEAGNEQRCTRGGTAPVRQAQPPVVGHRGRPGLGGRGRYRRLGRPAARRDGRGRLQQPRLLGHLSRR